MVLVAVVVFEVIFVALEKTTVPGMRPLQSATLEERSCKMPSQGWGPLVRPILETVVDTHISLASQHVNSHRNEALAATINKQVVVVCTLTSSSRLTNEVCHRNQAPCGPRSFKQSPLLGSYFFRVSK